MNEIPRIVKFIEAQSGRVIVKGSEEGGMTGECFSRISVWEDKKSYEDGWWQWLQDNVTVLNAMN